MFGMIMTKIPKLVFLNNNLNMETPMVSLVVCEKALNTPPNIKSSYIFSDLIIKFQLDKSLRNCLHFGIYAVFHTFFLFIISINIKLERI